MNKKYVKINIVLIIFILSWSVCGAKSGDMLYESEIQTGNLIGVLLDTDTGEPVGWTTLYIKEINRSVSSHADGTFHFFDIPAGKFKLNTFRIGYLDGTFDIQVQPNDTTRLTIKLSTTNLETETIIVESAESDNNSKLMSPEIEISGKKLRQNLSMTIAKTLESEPGISQRTMGPAPARPVLRGLGGDRLLILEDGERTGDMSATSSDHAVVIEPISSERIEVIRGPEALIYGSNTLGGVVNVARGYVPTTLPHRIFGNASFQGESVNTGFASGIGLNLPVRNFALRLDGSFRKAHDISTPSGKLRNTFIESKNMSSGMSYFNPWGFIGAAISYYESDYGIPPDPRGGHPFGVDIYLNRKHFELESELYPDFNWLYRIDMDYSFKSYEHSELEADGDLGIKYGVLTHNFSVLSHLNQRGAFSHGEIGFWGEARDYDTAGLSFTPATQEYSGALFVYGEHTYKRFAFNGSVRFDHKVVVPQFEKIIRRADYNMNIRRRQFSDFSGGVSAIYEIGNGLSAGSSFMRTFRAPGVEELFTEGPHLAAYSYEVGNSELDKEIAYGADIFMDYKYSGGNFHFALFRNDISGYIFPKNSGRRSLRRADLFLYQFQGENTLFYGFESTWKIRLLKSLYFGGSASYVFAELVDRDEAVPRIPPFSGMVDLRYETGPLSLTWTSSFADEQKRAGEFETPTDGYFVCNIAAEYYFHTKFVLNTISLSVDNIGDRIYRQHLNRVKEIMPEPGRNVKLLYKVYF